MSLQQIILKKNWLKLRILTNSYCGIQKWNTVIRDGLRSIGPIAPSWARIYFRESTDLGWELGDPQNLFPVGPHISQGRPRWFYHLWKLTNSTNFSSYILVDLVTVNNNNNILFRQIKHIHIKHTYTITIYIKISYKYCKLDNLG